ncbi:MAG: OmpA family protein [Betaproteobacteria bacterium]|nr:OmpA family protein [Betaproteobacteria bacterium]
MHVQRNLVLLVLSFLLLPTHGNAQERELIDVMSFFNGAFPYRTGHGATQFAAQISAISGERTKNSIGTNKGDDASYFYYSLAAPATIETFRFAAGEGTNIVEVPRRIEFAVSSSPEGDFQTVAAFDMPESHFSHPNKRHLAQYDYSVPVQQKISGRYVRIALSGSRHGRYRFSHFSAYGRFDQPITQREDFGGYYFVLGSEVNSMLTGVHYNSSSRIMLKQEGGLIQGCYVHGTKGRVTNVTGTFIGGVENNVARLTYTHAESGLQSSMALGLAYLKRGETSPSKQRDDSAGKAYLVLDDGKGKVAAEWTVRYSDEVYPCAVNERKEITASEAMQESLEKTGKVQLYGVNFDFDSDVLRPESSTVLDEVVNLAKANPSWKFEVGGHTDSVGLADYNLKLSSRRAASVVRYLTDKGVDAARLKSRGYGATRPLVKDADNDAAHAQNRRVELVKQ